MITFIDLISGIEKEYDYGKYSPLQMELIGKFLSDNKIDYVTAAEKILGYHSKSFKSLPDYAMFKKCFESDAKARDEADAVKAYAMLERKCYPYSSLAIKGTRFITALDRIGGWLYFCNRTKDEAPFLKERFIKAYVSATDGDDIRKYTGELETADKNMIYIGCDKNEFIQLENKNNPLQVLMDKKIFSKEDLKYIAADIEIDKERGV
jgi:hypothetical protein